MTRFNYTCCWVLLRQLMGLSLAPVSLSAGRQKSSFNSSNRPRTAFGPDQLSLFFPLSSILLPFSLFYYDFPYITAPTPSPYSHSCIKKLYHRDRDPKNTINTHAWSPLCCWAKMAVISLFSLLLELSLLNCIYWYGSFHWVSWEWLLSSTIPPHL